VPTIKNVSPLRDLDVPLLNRQGDNCLKAGEEVEVSDEHAGLLLIQPEVFAPVDAAAQAAVPDPVDPEPTPESNEEA